MHMITFVPYKCNWTNIPSAAQSVNPAYKTYVLQEIAFSLNSNTLLYLIKTLFNLQVSICDDETMFLKILKKKQY